MSKRVKTRLTGICNNYVYDILRCRTPELRSEFRNTRERFKILKEDQLPCQFSGFTLSRKNGVPFKMDLNKYLSKLVVLLQTAIFWDFRSMRIRITWISNSRPHCLFSINHIAQVTESMILNNITAHIKKLKIAVRYAVQNPGAFGFPKLYLETLRVVGYSDASFSSNYNIS